MTTLVYQCCLITLNTGRISMRPQNHQLENSPNAPRKLHSRLALAFTRDFGAKRNSVWILLILLLAQVFCSKATLKQEALSCSQIGRPESNVTLMNGLDNPKVHRFILGHVKTLEECVQIACKRQNITLAYTSRFDCFGISCDGEEETCWLLPSFQNPTLVFARLQRGIPKVHNTTINKAGKLSKVHPKQKHKKKSRSVDDNQREDSSSNEKFTSTLNVQRRSKDDELISTLSSKTRTRRNVIPVEGDKHERSQRSVGEKPFLELPYLWKRRRKMNQRIRREVIKAEGVLGKNFAEIRNFNAGNRQKSRDSYFDSTNKPLERQKREIEDDLPQKQDETMVSDSDTKSGQTGFSGSGNEEINNIQDNQGDMEAGQTSLSGSGSDVKMKSQEALQRYKRNFDDDDDDSSDDLLSFLGGTKMKGEQQDNEVRRYKRKLDDDDDDDDNSSGDVWSSENGASDPPSDAYSGYNEHNEDSEERNSLRRYKRKAVEPEEMDELSKALSSASPSKHYMEEELGSGESATTKAAAKKMQPSTSSSPTSSITLSTATSSSSPSSEQSQVESDNESKSKKKISLPVKKEADASPQGTTSTSSSASISISSIPPPPPPPPSSTSSSSSISMTTSSTGSLPVSQSSQTSTTKVSSSTTVPKSLDSKKKVAPEKHVKPASLTKKGPTMIHQETVNKDMKKSSAVPPQESTSSSSSTSISISPVPLPPPPPPSTTSVSQSSSSSTKVSVSTSTFPKVKSSKNKDASKKHVEMTTKKSSAIPPQESTSSSSSTSISISPVPLPPPPPPSTTSQSSSSSTKVSVSTSTFPKVKSSKNKDASKKHVKMAAASSSKPLKSSSSKTKASSAKSRSSSSVSPSKKRKSVREKRKRKKRSKRTWLKQKRNETEKKTDTAEKADKPTQKSKRQAPYIMGLGKIGISKYNQGTRSNIRPPYGNNIGYNRPKVGQGTHKLLQQRGPFSSLSYQNRQSNGYGLQGRNNERTSSFHQPVVSSIGAQSAQAYAASTTRLPYRSIIPRPSIHLGFSQPRSFVPSTIYLKPNAARPDYQQIPLPGRTYQPAYVTQPTIPGRFRDQGGSVLAAQMKSLIPHYKTMQYASTRPVKEKINAGQGFEGKSCGFALGMQDGKIKDEQLSSSSDYSMYHSAARGRLGNSPKQNGLAGAWCTGAKNIDRSQYLQVDLGQRRRVCRVATQGMPELPVWVKEYALEFSNNGHIWADYTEEGHEKLFEGNTDRNTPVSHSLKQPITARFIRFKPQSWNGPSICMRAELYTSTDPEVKPRDRISKQGLVVYLNFDKSESKFTESRRTEISRAPGVCGDVANLRNGNIILLDGRKIQPKPRDAITIAAWIRLDNTSGQHSIFDTVGGHSSHGSGQYHFEVSDGKLRWYHRNETANQIFSSESDTVVSENTWTHVAGTYDSHTGISKVYIDGHVNGQAQGSGLLSQDWDSHVGIGRHKDSRFLNGLVDEFRIYDYAMEEPEIKNLMKKCDYAKSCGGLLGASTGIIESPNWPNGYKDAKTCTWKIAVDKTDRIALNFETFGLQEDGNCDKSRLVIKDGEDEDAKEIGEFCGLNSPRLMRSTGNHMWLQFKSTPEGQGKGFHLTYQAEETHQTKKQDQPRVPVQNMKCSASTPEYNVTLTGGIKAGTFSEALGVKTLDLCMRQCCLKESCSLAFMISDSCYLVRCKDDESCKTKKARPSGMNPTIVYITHLKEEPHSGLPEEGTSLDNPRPNPPPSQCHHTDVSYNATLVGGIKAGKFNTFGQMSNIDDCIRHCCHDDKCDVVFMIQNNCYNVECADSHGCQMKRAKPSPYNPTLVYVYRGDNKPVAEPVKKFNKPPRSSCRHFQVSDTLHNVTLVGGVKSGKFTDKGVVNDIEECKAFCCAEDTCNVAFLIRTNCFLVSCKDYDSCKVKPAISDYYRPKLAYVNWHAPDEEVSPYDKFASLGCWRDTDSFSMPSLEGTDPHLSESYRLRAKPIDTCASVALKHGYKVFGIHKGGACFSGPQADQTFNKFGESADCKNGRGGVGATDVYQLDYDGKYSKKGCWRDSEHRALKTIEHTNPRLNDFYQSRTSPVAKCAEVAKQQGYPVFALQDGGECLSGPTAEVEFNKYGVSRDCRGRLGGAYANSVYKLIGNFDLQNDEADNTSTAINETENSSNKASLSKPEGGTKQVIGEDLPSNSDTTSMKEDFVTMKNGKPKRIVYTAGKVQYNVTLKYGIQSGKFMDKGQVSNISQCTSYCGRQPDCDLAFMLGQKCFAVSCKSKGVCVTKPAFSAFYNPVIVFVTNRKIYDNVKSQQKRCHVSTVQNDVTLVGGINAGKFMDFGQISDMNTCVKRCCAKPTCDVAFKLEGQCYGVSCISNILCETRTARNAGRYKPQIAYIYHDRKGLDRVQAKFSVTNDNTHDKHEIKPSLEQKHAKKKTDEADLSLINDSHRDTGTEYSVQTSSTRHDTNRNTTDKILVDKFVPNNHNSERNGNRNDGSKGKLTTGDSYDKMNDRTNNKPIHLNDESTNNIYMSNKGKWVGFADRGSKVGTSSYRFGDVKTYGSHGNSINTGVIQSKAVNQRVTSFSNIDNKNNNYPNNDTNDNTKNNVNIKQESQETYRQRLLADFVKAGERMNQNIDKIPQSKVAIKGLTKTTANKIYQSQPVIKQGLTKTTANKMYQSQPVIKQGLTKTTANKMYQSQPVIKQGLTKTTANKMYQSQPVIKQGLTKTTANKMYQSQPVIKQGLTKTTANQMYQSQPVIKQGLTKTTPNQMYQSQPVIKQGLTKTTPNQIYQSQPVIKQGLTKTTANQIHQSKPVIKQGLMKTTANKIYQSQPVIKQGLMKTTANKIYQSQPVIKQGLTKTTANKMYQSQPVIKQGLTKTTANKMYQSQPVIKQGLTKTTANKIYQSQPVIKQGLTKTTANKIYQSQPVIKQGLTKTTAFLTGQSQPVIKQGLTKTATNKIYQSQPVIKQGLTKTNDQTAQSHFFFNGGLTKISPINVKDEDENPTYVKSNGVKETNFSVLSQSAADKNQLSGRENAKISKYITTLRQNQQTKHRKGGNMKHVGLVALGPNSGNVVIKHLNHLPFWNLKNNFIKAMQKHKHPIGLVAFGPNTGNILNHVAPLQSKNNNVKTKQDNKYPGLVALGPNSDDVIIKHLNHEGFHGNSPGQVGNVNGHGLQKIKLVANNDVTLTTNQQTGRKQTAISLVNPNRRPKTGQKKLSKYIHFLNTLLASDNSSIHGNSSSNESVCWDGDVLYNQTLIGGINAGVFTDNGKTTTMDLCMQSCCKQPACDLAFMIEDDCYSVACTSPSSCKTRAARPTQFYPRISFSSKFKDLMSKETSGLASGTSPPQEPSTHSPTHAAASSTKMTTTVAPRVQPSLKVHHSCSATPIKYNVTLRMGLHSGLFTKMGRVDSMDDCIELNCKQPKADVAFMMGTHCYAVQCYSEELCKTEPVFATSFSFLNLKPAVSFLRKNPGSTGHGLALRDNPRETCLESTITYDVTLRGGIHSGKFTERPHVNTMRRCVAECCDADSCDLAFMFGDRCYSVTCKSEKSCQAVLAKPTALRPRISYMSRTSPSNDGVSLAESEDVHPKCHADDISKSLIARNKTLAGGLEAGTFRFLGKVKSMAFCMRRCCARPRCDVAYLIDKNCFSISCFSHELCKITSDHSPANGDVEISAMLKSVKKEELPDEAHSVVVYIIVGTLLFAAGLGGIVWAVCMFLRRHRLRQRHRARSSSDG